MTLEEILNTDVSADLPEGTVIEDELSCQDEGIERLPNISTLLRASDFELGIINDQATEATIPATAAMIGSSSKCYAY